MKGLRQLAAIFDVTHALQCRDPFGAALVVVEVSDRAGARRYGCRSGGPVLEPHPTRLTRSATASRAAAGETGAVPDPDKSD